MTRFGTLMNAAPVWQWPWLHLLLLLLLSCIRNNNKHPAGVFSTNTHCCSACSLLCFPSLIGWLGGWSLTTSGSSRNQRRPPQIPKSGLQLHRYDDPLLCLLLSSLSTSTHQQDTHLSDSSLPRYDFFHTHREDVCLSFLFCFTGYLFFHDIFIPTSDH